ncbi:helix-turn-helix domain-containing protein [Bdellovibrio sp. HCB2-146]|uniref:helix-turn-helix domain-containing protein n=1 Tax=Bdellovibrio sp. HCB2-146 TaxID=3394362 RepID=UPI0039BC4711
MEHSQYLNAIKRVLKARSVTYQDLAEQLKMTESGIKKMLNAKDISFRRVLQICEAVGVLPGQLFSLSEKAFVSEVSLTSQQEEALLKNRPLLAVYWRIAIEGKDVAEVERLQKLTKAELKKMLDRLVALDLLSVRRGIYKARHSGKFKWSDDSKLAKTLNREWSQWTLEKALKRESRGLHRLVALQMSQDSYEQFLKKMNEVINTAIHDSEMDEMTVSKERLMSCSLVVASIPQGVLDL